MLNIIITVDAKVSCLNLKLERNTDLFVFVEIHIEQSLLNYINLYLATGTSCLKQNRNLLSVSLSTKRGQILKTTKTAH